MLREGSGGRRPWKVWDASRTKKRLILASSLEELRERGREKIGCDPSDPAVRLVLESDGTHIDDGEYLKWLADNTVFLLLRSGESWTPSLRPHNHSGAAASAPAAAHSLPHPQRAESSILTPIPRVVCEALNLLEIRSEPPFWKIIDNRGRITLVLHWELPPNNRIRYVEPNRSHQQHPAAGAAGSDMTAAESRTLSELRIKSVAVHPSEEVVTVVSDDGATVTTLKGGRMETLINNVHHHHPPAAAAAAAAAAAKERKSAESSSAAPYRVAATIHLPPPLPAGRHPHSGHHQQHHPHQHHHQHNADECEFHCGSLHEEGRSIQGAEGSRRRVASTNSGGSTKSHVRFHDQAAVAAAAEAKREHPPTSSGSRSSKSSRDHQAAAAAAAAAVPAESSESEVDLESSNTVEEEFENEGGVTTEKLLLLTDQLTADQRKHLTILDLGVILERLRAKIIDVERLEREREGPSCYRWMIKATIRGEVLRDLGVLYNGSYYSISEHPGLAYAASGFEDDEEDREDPV